MHEAAPENPDLCAYTMLFGGQYLSGIVVGQARCDNGENQEHPCAALLVYAALSGFAKVRDSDREALFACGTKFVQSGSIWR